MNERSRHVYLLGRKKIAISDIPTSEIKNELCLREFEWLDPTLNLIIDFIAKKE